MLEYRIVVLRVEQGFHPSLLSSDNPQLEGYTKYHQMAMPNMAAYDLLEVARTGEDVAKRLHNVRTGLTRSATLLLECDAIADVTASDDWLELRHLLDLPREGAAARSEWRFREDSRGGHYGFPDMGIWTATRNLAKYDETSVRERYTVTTPKTTPETVVRAVFEDSFVPDDFVIATATVYALNKAIKKPAIEELDWSQYPELAALRAH